MMHLFHHIVVFSLNEEEKRAFLEADHTKKDA
jgi:hypothetical protein